METHTTTCETESPRDLICDSGNSNQGSAITQKGGTVRKVGGRFKRAGT